MNEAELKSEVRKYWNKQSCGTGVSDQQKFSREYFDEIEAYRYSVEPEIHAFAQFTRFRGQRLLEVGVGAGTDFLQWVRAGTKAYGIDLTEEGIEHVRHRLGVYGLAAEDIRVGDAENLPHEDNFFDVIYSYGVIHHSPNTIRALEEIIRCLRIGGTGKVMIYNKYSLASIYHWMRHGLFKGRPFRTISDIMFHHQESPGTKVYSLREVREILARYPVEVVYVKAPVCNYDLLWRSPKPRRVFANLLARIMGYQTSGWLLMMEFRKTGPLVRRA